MRGHSGSIGFCSMLWSDHHRSVMGSVLASKDASVATSSSWPLCRSANAESVAVNDGFEGL